MSSLSGLSGFFTKRNYMEPQPVAKGRRSTSTKVLTCADCGLYHTVMSPPFPFSDSKLQLVEPADVLLVFDYPSGQMDVDGVPNAVEEFYIELLRSDNIKYNITYATQCHRRSDMPKDKVKLALDACYPHLQSMLRASKPTHVIPVGTNAIKAILGDWVRGKSAKDVAGMSFPYHPGGYWVHPMIDTTVAVLNSRQLANLIRKDYARIDFTLPPPVAPHFEDNVEIVKDYRSVCTLLKEISSRQGALVFDYETTRIRPQGVGARLAMVGFSVVYPDDTYEGTWVIPLENYHFFSPEQQKTVLGLWSKILREKNLSKVAQNITFEDIWSRVRGGVIIPNWEWCTENAEHIIDERTGNCGLKFQGTRYYGTFGYDDEVEAYTKSSNSEGINKVLEGPQDVLMLYCGIDVEITVRRFIEQRRIINGDAALRDCMTLFMNGLRCFCNLHERGLPIDIPYFEEKRNQLQKECAGLEEKIRTNPDVVSFVRKTGTAFNPGSAPVLRAFFFDYLGLSSLRSTTSGDTSTDKQVLEVLDHPVAEAILKLRTKQKIEGTYIAQFLREQVDGVLRPSFNLHTTRTGRSSSSNPNFQNVPKRGAEAAEICRRGVITPPGFRMFEADYSGVEVKMAGCYTRDPALLAYLNDPSTDMHYDLSEEVFCCPRSNLNKKIRNVGKNSATFPWFYGSYYVSVAKSLWEHILYDNLKLNDGTPLKDHIFSSKSTIISSRTGNRVQVKLDNLDNFTLHVKEVEKRFWDKFKVFKQWQENEIAVYEKELVTENFFGFCRRRDLSRNEIINTPFQGTGFQSLLWSIYRVDKTMVERKYRSYLVGQIHDAIVGYAHPSEEQEVFTLINDVMMHQLMAEHKWINVPLDIEIDASEVNGCWYEMHTWHCVNGVWCKKE